MPDLDQQIRAQIQTYDLTMDGRRMLKAAIVGVLDLHQPMWGLKHADATCPVCGGDYPEGAQMAMAWPCPTVQAIAHELGLTQETTP